MKRLSLILLKLISITKEDSATGENHSKDIDEKNEAIALIFRNSIGYNYSNFSRNGWIVGAVFCFPSG